MPRLEIGNKECIRVLARQHLVRVAFLSPEAPYLIPLGYVWLDGALYGVTEAGYKTRLATANPTVAFQVDSALETGLWEWESVTGTGTFALASEQQRAKALAALQPMLTEAPDWWRQEQMPRMAAGVLLVWKLTPATMSGCRYVPPSPAGN